MLSTYRPLMDAFVAALAAPDATAELDPATPERMYQYAIVQYVLECARRPLCAWVRANVPTVVQGWRRVTGQQFGLIEQRLGAAAADAVERNLAGSNPNGALAVIVDAVLDIVRWSPSWREVSDALDLFGQGWRQISVPLANPALDGSTEHALFTPLTGLTVRPADMFRAVTVTLSGNQATIRVGQRSQNRVTATLGAPALSRLGYGMGTDQTRQSLMGKLNFPRTPNHIAGTADGTLAMVHQDNSGLKQRYFVPSTVDGTQLTPSAALNGVTNPTAAAYTMECATVVSLTLYASRLALLVQQNATTGPATFDAEVVAAGGLEIGPWDLNAGASPPRMIALEAPARTGADLRHLQMSCQSLLVGDSVSVGNPDVSIEDAENGWGAENAIFVGINTNWEPVFFGAGISGADGLNHSTWAELKTKLEGLGHGIHVGRTIGVSPTVNWGQVQTALQNLTLSGATETLRTEVLAGLTGSAPTNALILPVCTRIFRIIRDLRETVPPGAASWAAMRTLEGNLPGIRRALFVAFTNVLGSMQINDPADEAIRVTSVSSYFTASTATVPSRIEEARLHRALAGVFARVSASSNPSPVSGGAAYAVPATGETRSDMEYALDALAPIAPYVGWHGRLCFPNGGTQ